MSGGAVLIIYWNKPLPGCRIKEVEIVLLIAWFVEFSFPVFFNVERERILPFLNIFP
jgi:hypothetical protein